MGRSVIFQASVFALISLSPCYSFADMGSLVMVDGTVDNFSDRTVDLVLENGAKVRIPRAKVGKSQDVRPGNVIMAVVSLEDIKPVKN